MGAHPKAHLIYGYKITSNINFNNVEEELFEKYNYPTEISPGFIYDMEGLQYFGLSIGECGENQDLIIKSNLDLEIPLDTKYKIKVIMRELTKNKDIENPKLYLTCLWH